MDKFALLQEIGAGDFQHLNGSLAHHLERTKDILATWGTSNDLQTAGLFHAAYGTAGFDESMVNLSQRQKVADVIGEQAEAIVYLYCSCDRDYVFQQINVDQPIRFRDRFTDETFLLNTTQARQFCELTVANELELVYASDAFKTQYGDALLELFNKMASNLSSHAIQAFQLALD